MIKAQYIPTRMGHIEPNNFCNKYAVIKVPLMVLQISTLQEKNETS
jgi:hypothetical protein